MQKVTLRGAPQTTPASWEASNETLPGVPYRFSLFRRRLVARAIGLRNQNTRPMPTSLPCPALGEVAGVATNSHGNVLVYVRAGQPVATLGTERTFYHGNSRLFEFDQNGKFVREIGRGTYAFDYAEQVRVDPQDNIWAVDAGSNMALMFDPEGRLLMVLGRKNENIPVRPGGGVPARLIDPAPPAGAPTEGGGAAPSAPGAGIRGEGFSQPTDITFDRDGNITTSPTAWATTIASLNSIAKATGFPVGAKPEAARDNSTRSRES